MGSSAFAQQWAPKGAKWTFGTVSAFRPIYHFTEWISKADTLIDGHNCRIIESIGDWVAGDRSKRNFIYEEKGVVYLSTGGGFSVLYDFTKKSGESWQTWMDTCLLDVTVDSIGSIIINGFVLRTLYISTDQDEFSGRVIEFIGHDVRPNPDVDKLCYQIVVDGDSYTGLRCYQDEYFGSVEFYKDCYYSTVGFSENHQSDDLVFFPNPARDKITINSLNLDYTHFIVRDLMGRISQFGIFFPGNKIIDLSSLPNGIYHIEIRGGGILKNIRFEVLK